MLPASSSAVYVKNPILEDALSARSLCVTYWRLEVGPTGAMSPNKKEDTEREFFSPHFGKGGRGVFPVV